MAHALIRGSCDGSEQEEEAAGEVKGGPQQIPHYQNNHTSNISNISESSQSTFIVHVFTNIY